LARSKPFASGISEENVQCSMFNFQCEIKDMIFEDRLVEYSCRMIDVAEALPKTREVTILLAS
jgi:hypothetical protein